MLSKLKHITLIFIFIAFTGKAFAYKIVKERDHWGILGGFSSVEDKVEGHLDSKGEFVIDKVSLKCTGWGNQVCSYTGAAISDDGGALGSAGEVIINSLFTLAEQLQEGGQTSGTFSQNHAILQSDGSYRYFHYNVSWSANDPNKIEIDINEINY